MGHAPLSNTANAPLFVSDKAFDWHHEFLQVFKEKTKTAFHITTALHDSRTSQRMIDYKVREKRFNGTLPEPQIFLRTALQHHWTINPEKGEAMAEVKAFHLGLLPIKDIPLSGQQPFIALADRMLTLHTGLQTKRRRFLKRLADNFGSSSSPDKGACPLVETPRTPVITKTLERFDELEFAQFLAELKKQKITLTLKQQDEWEEYFTGYKTECCTFARQIHDTDTEID
jgi:hypothetical protein